MPGGILSQRARPRTGLTALLLLGIGGCVAFSPCADAGSSVYLTQPERESVLGLARWTIEKRLSTGRTPEFDEAHFPLTPRLRSPCGAFVTLTKNGVLRGCVGYVVAVAPLYKAVMEMAVNAAVGDPRFPPVTAEELGGLRVEVSVLTPMVPCADYRKVEVGVHGLFVRREGCSGLLLPQVAVEWKWDRTRFLEQVCLKAGLPPDTYKMAGTELFTFRAEVFHESR